MFAVLAWFPAFAGMTSKIKVKGSASFIKNMLASL
jgi:hypothetical protein